MGYSSVWRVLDKMFEDLRKKGAHTSPNVLSDLKSAKTLLRVLKADVTDGEVLRKIDFYLQNVESDLVSEAQKQFGGKYADSWLKKLDAASRKKPEEAEEKARFVPGLPREQKWIRVQPSRELPSQRLMKLAEGLDLSCTLQHGGCLLVCGKAENLGQFVREMTSEQKNKTN